MSEQISGPPGATPVREARAVSSVPRWLRGVLLAAPAVAFLALALVSVVHRPLWRDEAATLEFASLPLRDLARAVSHIDVVLAPYYVLMHGVVATTSHVAALRVPSALAGGAAVLFITLAVRARWGLPAGVIAGLFLGLSGAFFDTATTARPYALSAGLLAAAAWVGSRDRRGGSRRTYVVWILILCGAAALQPLSAMAFPGLALGLGRRRSWRSTFVAAAIPCVFAGALVLASRAQGSQVSWIKRLPFARALDQAERAAMLTTWLPVLILVGLALLVQLVRRSLDMAWLSWCAAFVLPPFALWVATKVAVPLFVMRYAVMFLPALAGLVGASAGLLFHELRRNQRIPLAALIALVCGWNAWGGLQAGLAQRGSLDGTDRVASYLSAHVAKGDTIVYFASISAGGQIYGWAWYEKDAGLQKDLLQQLPDAKGAQLQVRDVTGLSPLTTRSTTVLKGDVWVVGGHTAESEHQVPGMAGCRTVERHKVSGVPVVRLTCGAAGA